MDGSTWMKFVFLDEKNWMKKWMKKLGYKIGG